MMHGHVFPLMFCRIFFFTDTIAHIYGKYRFIFISRIRYSGSTQWKQPPRNEIRFISTIYHQFVFLCGIIRSIHHVCIKERLIGENNGRGGAGARHSMKRWKIQSRPSGKKGFSKSIRWLAAGDTSIIIHDSLSYASRAAPCFLGRNAGNTNKNRMILKRDSKEARGSLGAHCWSSHYFPLSLSMINDHLRQRAPVSMAMSTVIWNSS